VNDLSDKKFFVIASQLLVFIQGYLADHGKMVKVEIAEGQDFKGVHRAKKVPRPASSVRLS
jgi:hypothetical protein